MYAGWLSCAPSAMINFGQIVAAFLAEPIGKTKIQCITVLTVGGALLGGMSLQCCCKCSLTLRNSYCVGDSGNERSGYGVDHPLLFLHRLE